MAPSTSQVDGCALVKQIFPTKFPCARPMIAFLVRFQRSQRRLLQERAPQDTPVRSTSFLKTRIPECISDCSVCNAAILDFGTCAQQSCAPVCAPEACDSCTAAWHSWRKQKHGRLPHLRATHGRTFALLEIRGLIPFVWSEMGRTNTGQWPHHQSSRTYPSWCCMHSKLAAYRASLLDQTDVTKQGLSDAPPLCRCDGSGMEARQCTC